MSQLSTSDFRKGSKVILDGEPYDMLEVNFVKPGKGQALYKCRLKNLIKGTLLDRTYKSGDGLEAGLPEVQQPGVAEGHVQPDGRQAVDDGCWAEALLQRLVEDASPVHASA